MVAKVIETKREWDERTETTSTAGVCRGMYCV